MNGPAIEAMPPPPPGAAHVHALEAELLERASLIGAVYGVIILLGLAVGAYFYLRLRARPPRLREAVSRLIWRPWDLRASLPIFFALAGAFVLAAFFQGPLLRLGAALEFPAASAVVILQSAVFHWTGLLATTWVLARRRVPWRSAFGLAPRSLARDGLLGLLILLGVMPVLIGVTLIYHLLLEGLGYRATLQEVAFAISDEPSTVIRAYFFFLAAVLAPVFEEILFRGILLPLLARRFGVLAAAVAVSLLFAGIHGHVPSLVPLFALSMALCAAYLGVGSLAAPVAMHALFNSITVTLLFVIR